MQGIVYLCAKNCTFIFIFITCRQGIAFLCKELQNAKNCLHMQDISDLFLYIYNHISYYAKIFNIQIDSNLILSKEADEMAIYEAWIRGNKQVTKTLLVNTQRH